MCIVIYLFVLISFLFKIVFSNDSSEVSLTTAKLRKSTSPKPTTLSRRINDDRNLYEISNSSAFVELEALLTTAKLRKSTSPKPTTLYRRINVDRNHYEISNSSGLVDLFRYVEARRKRGSETYSIVDWDYWCRLQPKKGDCQKTLNRFYYDTLSDECKPFVYSGCDGNKNNFYTNEFCERHCKGAINTNIKDLKGPEFCSLQAQTGFCLALIPQYYYDINEETCVKFHYGGCGGNQNRFHTISSCMKACSDKEYE
ncbi:unnamed protein product [Euphydryas editha]|uniref:BPTI/Kunitz inhibitor domain-containing protein n=1 Tax=Euphydryas editha TaxID=104508 RepID=A0AAU9V8V0_EUPED|nr:unnamed protein product [Euphydryas editha]